MTRPESPSREAATGAMVAACRELVAEVGCSPPISLKRLLPAFGARWEPRKMSADGHLRRDERGYLINYAAPGSTGWRRRRFTIAHELAHLVLLERLGPVGRELAEGGDWREVERLCNAGAAEILLPRDAFAAALLERGFSRDGLAGLFELFGVSWSVLFIRLAEILEQAAVALWREDEEGELRLVETHWGERRFWMPTGLGVSHSEPNLPGHAREAGFASADRLEVSFGSTTVAGRGMAIALDRLRRPGDQPLPGLAEREMRSLPNADVALLILAEQGEGPELSEALWLRSVPVSARPTVGQMELAVAR